MCRSSSFHLSDFRLMIGAICFQCLSFCGSAQVVNWAGVSKEREQAISVMTGWDYGVVFGADYRYQLSTHLPWFLDAAVSVPAGKNLTDDFKTKLGTEIRFVKAGPLHLSGSIRGLYRRYEKSFCAVTEFRI